jgi:GNAT superfamily N-acetyltransferase
MLVRTAHESDIPGMAVIRALEWGSRDEWERRLAAYLAGTHYPQKALRPRACYVAMMDDTLAGFIAGHLTRRYGCDGELQWINVHPEWQRRQVGSGLLREMASWFVDERAVRVCVDVDPGNAPARAFYERHGALELNRHWLVWNDITPVSLGEHPG